MAKVSIKSLDQLNSVSSPEVYSGASNTLSVFDGEQDPLHLYVHELNSNNKLSITSSDIDRLVYVWTGAVSVGGIQLSSGSSLIVEHGQSVQINNAKEKTLLLTFSGATAPADSASGGNIHLLPAEKVSRYELATGLKGGMHADSACPTCNLWLHENSFPGQTEQEAKSDKAIHCHSEDEIIFVTSGEINFGTKTGGPGTALFIAADTFYSFTAGPEGLSFINFRASMPTDIRFKDGSSMSETEYWHKLVSRPQYLTVS